MAEIIPVEPDQGNACAGKVAKTSLFLSAFAYAAFPSKTIFVTF
jgi:hypothetical protein